MITEEKAAEYVDKAHAWLEGFNLGYKRSDPSTYHSANLPRCGKGGLYSLFSFAHAQFVWDLKTDPKYVECFEKIWGTDELAVSFDGGYLGVPLPKEELGDEAKPWPHADQSPFRTGQYCIQSLINLVPNKKEDGGLWVMKGSANLFGEWVKAFNATEIPDRGRGDHFRYHADDLKWYEDHGCEWVHPDLGPGDVVFWDSRTAHYGAAPTSTQPRMAVYSCYKPANLITPEQLKLKQEAFKRGFGTSHDPITFIWKENSEAPYNITFPYGKPVLSEKALKAAGMIPYH